jgi:SAM-dependent methyltransferase
MQQAYPQHTQCLISGSKDLRPLKGYERHYLVKSYSLGFVFCSRIPTDKELAEHYATYNREEYYSPITRDRYRQLLTEWEPFRKTNKILDIGCGTGFFLEVAKEKGWEVYGTEFTDEAVTICKNKGINMQKGRLTADWYNPEQFDIITSFEVLEHIYNPIEEVQNIHTILRKGGLFYLTTPNFNAVERYMLKDNYNVIEYPEHLSYYTPKTLNYLFTRNGFRKMRVMTTGISFTRIKVSGQKAENTAPTETLVSATSTDERMRVRSESNPLLKLAKNIVNGMLNLSRTGNSLKGWYIRV